ncbi:sugar O-acetyltransferase [Pedosphaera parvula]|uniref:Transferase hexapeptide repeat containing protein n=1 Tax=Pedosphaera parvula (strain Ellin514) TaxID=320771 RepID=B9XLP0_PEDPL|nr:sugar O-acetyltransferase [Pedosphaera parvula]EEF59288.1 transferase hexapeptide repeat containing protein [Pedosphaera parvula Ellin514]
MEKSELQKMLDGELYVANDPQLIEMRLQARELFTRYNQMRYADKAGRQELLAELFGEVGESTDIQAPFYCDYGCHIFAGPNLFMNFGCVVLDCARVTLGRNVSMGPNVQIYTAYHPLNAAERIKGPELAAPIWIGDNVWIGGSSIICPGVKIGENTTIGAGSVVTKDMPANVFVAGNPCRVIREI